MDYKNYLRATLLLITYALFSVVSIAQQASPDGQTTDVSRWKTFANRAGWSIKYPSKWRVGSCRSCSDPTDPRVFVMLSDPSTNEMVMIEHLLDKPSDQSIEQWLDDIKKTTNLDPPVSEKWISLDGMRALKVINRNRDAAESESIYVVHGSKTFAIRTDVNTPSYPLFQRMLSTFKFTTR